MFIQGLEEARIIEGYRKFPSNKLVIIRNKRINEFNMKIEEKVAKLVEKIKKLHLGAKDAPTAHK